jgi:hypothetical protein
MKTLIVPVLLGLVSILPVHARDNPLVSARKGDWAKYLVTTDVEGNRFLSSRDVPRWWAVDSTNADGRVVVRNFMFIQGKRVSAGGSVFHAKGSFEPIAFSKNARVEIVSRSTESIAALGRSVECTKFVRKVDSPCKPGSPGWVGTSTLWLSDSVPIGLVRMENEYDSQISPGGKPSRNHEIWTLAEAGADWKE